MSLLCRDELGIVLAPGRVGLLRTQRRLTSSGYARDVQSKKVVPCETDGGGEQSWNRAIDTLAAELPPIIGDRMEVNVILSNHFMKYMLVPWFDKLSDAEEMALAQHCFSETYGTAADSLSVRISPGRAGAASLASAVDMGLLQELSGLLGRMKLRIKSIQPHLMLAYNSCRAHLAGHSAWVALLEPGSLCLAALQDGQLVWIRKIRIGDDWQTELPAILERESCLADTQVAMDEVFLWAPHPEGQDFQSGWGWKVQHLIPDPNPGHALEYVGRYVLEMGL